MTTCVVSVGYERRDVDKLVALLLEHGVARAVDVRKAPVADTCVRHPASRMTPAA